MRCLIALALGSSILLATTTAAANPAERKAVMTEYVELLAFPNVADNREDTERLTAHLVKAMERRGLAPRILRGPDSKTPPAIYGEWRVSGASKTLVLYAHHDGQPVDPRDWTLSKPFEPTFRTGKPGAWSAPLALPSNPNDWPRDLRVFARSASDDKLGVMAIFAAIDRLKAKGAAPTFNLKILFDGEEEAGSTGLPSILAANRDLLRSDGWVIFDGPSLDVLGMRSADVGLLARNVIPTTATATLGLRLTKGDDVARQIERLRAHIRSQGFLVLDRDPTAEERLSLPLIAKMTAGTGYNAERTDADHWLVRQVSAAVRSTGPAVLIPTGGGSLPLSMISVATGAPTLTVSSANYDNNQHAEDENLRIENLWRAIDIAEAILQSR